MEEIIQIKNVSYARYEELLMRRDNLQKEAFHWDREYVRVFGDKILKVFEVKLECIKKKKAISYCQAVANHGGVVNQNELQNYLELEMSTYQAQLDAMVEDNKAAKDAHEISQVDILQIKKIYRKLAKQFHPDINPKTQEIEELQDLWKRISIAYKCNRLKDIKELEILATTALKSLGVGKLEIEIPDIDEKIAEVEEEIEHIRNTDPYRYKIILEDADTREEKNQSLDEEYASYKEYSEQLDEILQEWMVNGVTFTWKMNWGMC